MRRNKPYMNEFDFSLLLNRTVLENHAITTMVHPIAEATADSVYGDKTPAEFYAHHNITHSTEIITNSRGLQQFTQWWIPQPPTKIIGLVAVVHGYTGESSWFVELTAVHISKSGFIVFAIDHQGHGFSEGLSAHIPDINPVVNDCVDFFDSFRKHHAPNLPAFLYAESLGGAISLLITLKKERGLAWDGLVLNGAMCGVSPKFKPPWPLEHLLSIAAAVIPTWKVVPTRGSIPDVSFKEEWKRKLAVKNPRRILHRPRAATAAEFLRVYDELQRSFEKVDVPFLIVHGSDDVVCDVGCVEELYKRASSKDKTLKVYKGMWHQLAGEPVENVEEVFGDIIDWLKTKLCALGVELEMVPDGEFLGIVCFKLAMNAHQGLFQVVKAWVEIAFLGIVYPLLDA